MTPYADDPPMSMTLFCTFFCNKRPFFNIMRRRLDAPSCSILCIFGAARFLSIFGSCGGMCEF